MPGKRMLDESICIDKRLNNITEGSENLFYRMLARTDDAGNVYAEPDLIKSQIYPRRPEITLEDIKKRLLELHNSNNGQGLGLIELYSNNGQLYANFPNFFKHQKLRSDIKLKIQYPLRTCNNSLHACTDPFTQVSKLSKQVSNDVTELDIKNEIKKLRKIYSCDRDIDSIKSLLLNMGFTEDAIDKEVTKK